MTHITVIIFHTPYFISTKPIFNKIQIFLPNFAFFSIKSPSITQRSVSQEKAFKKSKTHRFFFSFFFFFLQNYGLKYLFYSNWKQLQVFEITKCELKVTIHYSLWAKCTQLWPLKKVAIIHTPGIAHCWLSLRWMATNSSTFFPLSSSIMVPSPRLFHLKHNNTTLFLCHPPFLLMTTKLFFCLIKLNLTLPLGVK